MAHNPRRRLRTSFAEKLQQQAGELAALAQDAAGDLGTRDVLRNELARIQATAASLGVEAVERAASSAREACDRDSATEAVKALLDVCRGVYGIDTVLRPVVLLTRSSPEVEEYATAVCLVTSVDEALDLAGRQEPGAFIVDLPLMVELCSRLPADQRTIPVYAVGEDADLDARVKAVHLGAHGYLSAPLDVSAALARVRALTGSSNPPPFRVLLFEPDEVQGQRAVGAIEGPDCHTFWLRQPTGLIDALERFWPDLIVIATTATEPSGLDLASVVQGHQRFGEVPVLFLAEPEDVERTGFVASADDILIKPVPRGILRARVRGRVRRARQAAQMRQYDLMTGCLNRGPLLRAADREVSFARRAEAPLTVVLVDVDGFSAFNLERGVSEGDRLLRGLAELLRTRLRETDIVGRMGGDSFALLLPGCRAGDGLRRVEILRSGFQQWAMASGIGSANFSAGVADTEGGLGDVLARADDALLEARSTGGGRSVRFGAPRGRSGRVPGGDLAQAGD